MSDDGRDGRERRDRSGGRPQSCRLAYGPGTRRAAAAAGGPETTARDIVFSFFFRARFIQVHAGAIDAPAMRYSLCNRTPTDPKGQSRAVAPKIGSLFVGR